MISVKCKKCGWKIPFSAKANKGNIYSRRINDVACPKCGKTLIKIGGKPNRWY